MKSDHTNAHGHCDEFNHVGQDARGVKGVLSLQETAYVHHLPRRVLPYNLPQVGVST